MIYEPQIHPTHIMMDEEVEKSPLGQKMKNELIERCSRSNTPALWIIENYHRKGYRTPKSRLTCWILVTPTGLRWSTSPRRFM
ncbi:TPA: hypothetical protein RUX41_002803 [Aeromonas dhakensis]|nr:hypothetical protein [Aeromonas dhakensis]